ncbi:flagellar FlbD family protein [Bacillus sp. 03113]|uniref:flagellar FlbD family protein n=1 Tax=Bacillus sp. 03113 TaxID=2578211 RepID=UPI001142C18A|nr:flagellar FlbD family protein [Bacillus sp. 03113]
MIKVTRLNGKPFFINALFIETIESFPDTTLMLTNGRKYVVKETEKQIVNSVLDYYKSINLFGLDLCGESDHEE